MVPRSPSSYALVGDFDSLVDYLERLHFHRYPTRSPHEALRLRSGRGAIVVCFHTGTILIQGQHQAQTHVQLCRFVESEVQ
jgi:hypothetical protein